FLTPRPSHQCSSLFPYTTLFRSNVALQSVVQSYSQFASEHTNENLLPLGHFDFYLYVISRRLYQFRLTITFQYSYECLRFQQNIDRKSTRLNSSHVSISYAVFCL